MVTTVFNCSKCLGASECPEDAEPGTLIVCPKCRQTLHKVPYPDDFLKKRNAYGSGIRFNEGKVPYEYLPLDVLVSFLDRHKEEPIGPVFDPKIMLLRLAAWQRRDEMPITDLVLYSMDKEGLPGFAEAARVFKHVTERPVKPYPMWNWARGMKWSIPLGCAVRHTLAMMAGEVNDPETELPHRGHLQCNLIMLLCYKAIYPDGDDRPEEGLFSVRPI